MVNGGSDGLSKRVWLGMVGDFVQPTLVYPRFAISD